MIEKVRRQNSTVYELDGKYHRTNGPAMIWDNGYWCWWLHGARHRYYGHYSSTVAYRWSIHGSWV